MPEVQTITIVRDMDMITVQGALSSANITSTGILACGVRCGNNLCFRACMSQQTEFCHSEKHRCFVYCMGPGPVNHVVGNTLVWHPRALILELVFAICCYNFVCLHVYTPL